jgi:hypothetical protein
VGAVVFVGVRVAVAWRIFAVSVKSELLLPDVARTVVRTDCAGALEGTLICTLKVRVEPAGTSLKVDADTESKQPGRSALQERIIVMLKSPGAPPVFVRITEKVVVLPGLTSTLGLFEVSDGTASCRDGATFGAAAAGNWFVANNNTATTARAAMAAFRKWERLFIRARLLALTGRNRLHYSIVQKSGFRIHKAALMGRLIHKNIPSKTHAIGLGMRDILSRRAK